MATKKTFTLEEAQKIGEQLGITWSNFDVNQFLMGINIELEHGTQNLETNVTDDDYLATGKIALAHLEEIPDYYDRLVKIEAEAEGK